jgi:opacity protein-like surface antigen
MRKQTILASLMVLGFAGPALATEGFSYSFVELGWVSQDFDDLDVDADGPGIRASIELTPAFHLFGSYSDQDFDVGTDSDVNGESITLGAGYAWSLSSKVDLVANAAYLRQELDVQLAGFGSGSVEDDGLGVGAYVRARPIEQLELTGGLNYVDFDDSGDDTYFSAGARFFVTKMFALGLDVQLNSDTTAFILGGRFDFGAR